MNPLEKIKERIENGTIVDQDIKAIYEYLEDYENSSIPLDESDYFNALKEKIEKLESDVEHLRATKANRRKPKGK